MALPGTYPKIIHKTIASGVVVSLVPGDPNFDLILTRAPDSSGSPGTPVDIGRIPASPLTGVYVLDALPVDGTTYYYRARHVRDGWTDGPASPWSRPSKAAALAALPTSLVTLQPVFGSGGVSDESIGTDGIIVLGPDGRDQLVFNGNAEQGLAYWQAVNAGGPLSRPIPLFTGVNLSLETSTPFGGTASFKFTSVTNGGVQQTTRAIDAATESAGPLLFRVRNGDRFRTTAALKASVGSTIVNVWMRLNSDLDLEESVVLLAQLQGVGTSWVEFDASQTTSLISLNQKYGSIMVTSNHTDGRTVYFDSLQVTRMTQSADLAVPITLVVP